MRVMVVSFVAVITVEVVKNSDDNHNRLEVSMPGPLYSRMARSSWED